MSIMGPQSGSEFLRDQAKRLGRLERRPASRPLAGPSSARPAADSVARGGAYWDSDLRRPIYSDGASWWFSDGTAVPSAG